jgi:hypothetical protein
MPNDGGNYNDLMKTAWKDIPVAQVLPNGTWKLRCKSASYKPAREEGKADTVLIVYEAIEPMEDVSEDALAELGADYDYTMKPIFHRVWIKESQDMDRFRTLLAKHAIDTNDYENGIEAMKALKGTEVKGYLTQSTYKDKTENTISSFNLID